MAVEIEDTSCGPGVDAQRSRTEAGIHADELAKIVAGRESSTEAGLESAGVATGISKFDMTQQFY
jgi:hypothetical protein